MFGEFTVSVRCQVGSTVCVSDTAAYRPVRLCHCHPITTITSFVSAAISRLNQSINQSVIYLPEKFVKIKVSKTTHMRTGQQGKTLTAAL